MYKRFAYMSVLFFLSAALCFGQAGALRDYVGLISIRYHPEVIAYMGKIKETFEKKGYVNSAKSIDNYLKGLSGSGFAYVSADGTCYILTNEHVISKSDTLSVTFEKQDGAKTSYDRLKVIYVDEDKDLALLVFETGAKPFTQGLSFNKAPIDEGFDVFAAGFPGLGNTAIWQFSRGTISNVAARLPKNNSSDETIGPYIQHTAQVDPGNSGGPLLIAAQGVPAGYSVIGINTLSAFRRQAANYAIPMDQINSFIESALSTEPVNERELIAKKADDFIRGFKENKAAYGHISSFLSTGCIATNAEYAILELLDKAPRAILDDIDSTFSNNPVEGMNAAVAWSIENSMRSKSGAIKISLGSINPNDKGGFNVVFNVNDAPVQSEWIKEYGVYRMDTCGSVAAGDKTLVDQKQKKRELEKGLRTNYNFSVMTGYTYILTYGSAINASFRILSPFTFGADFYYCFGNTGYFQVGLAVGYAHPVRLTSFALMPFGEIGFSILTTDSSRQKIPYSSLGFGFAAGFTAKAGMMFTFAKVPGLFGRVFYQHSIPFFKDQNESIKHHGLIGAGIGYGF